MLRNETLYLKPTARGTPLAIVGLDDEWSGHIDPDTACDGVDRSLPIICLNHNPANCRELLALPLAVDAERPHARPAGRHQPLRQTLLPAPLPPLHPRLLQRRRPAPLREPRAVATASACCDWCRPEITVFKLGRSREVERGLQDARIALERLRDRCCLPSRPDFEYLRRPMRNSTTRTTSRTSSITSLPASRPTFARTTPLNIVGIRTRGETLAERLDRDAARAAASTQIGRGVLDITLYRDDLSEIGPRPLVRPTQIDIDIDGMPLLLVDDVLFTGRSIRAALDALSDFGRPSAIRLAVLVDRGGRELPIQPDFVGLDADATCRATTA